LNNKINIFAFIIFLNIVAQVNCDVLLIVYYDI